MAHLGTLSLALLLFVVVCPQQEGKGRKGRLIERFFRRAIDFGDAGV
jgi:hypothetical protein